MRRLALFFAVVVVLAGVIWWLAAADGPPTSPAAAPYETPHVAAAPPSPPAPTDAPEEAAPVVGAAVIDLDVLRAELPENLYWASGAPTEDPTLQQERLAELTRRNTLYGKILSGTATDDEIADYYAHRERISRDYIAFAQRVLDRYGDQLTDEERGLYGLSIDMHGKRLQELPRAKQDAYARKKKQDDARAAWKQP